jgi:hypothetical protein
LKSIGWLLVAALLFLGGCSSQASPDAQEKGAHILATPEHGTMPLGPNDLKPFEVELFRQLSVPPDTQKDFRILQTKSVPNGSYVLYALPHNDGLAFAGRRDDGSIVMYKAHWPLAVTDEHQDLVVVRAVPPNNAVNPPYGVLAGRVYSPYIETIEVNYRDGRKDRVDVTNTRGFIMVRKSFDPRYVQVRGYGMNGSPYWSLDTR